METGAYECLEILLKNGSRPQSNVAGDFPPVCLAVMSAKLAATKLLLQFGANPDVMYGTDRAIHIAVRESNTACLHALIEGGANVNAENECFETPLMCSDFPVCLEVLVNAGADLELRNSIWQTPLLRAVEQNAVHAIQFFLEHGANPEVRMNLGRTALIFAVSAGRERCAALLLENGADVEAADDNGRTALVWATLQNCLGCVKLLLGYSARVCVKNQQVKHMLLRLIREETFDAHSLLRKHLVELRMKLLRGVLRFLIVTRRYREEFYKTAYVRIGAKSFEKRRLELEPQTSEYEPEGSSNIPAQSINSNRAMSQLDSSTEPSTKRACRIR